jgi:hypothetical protein
MDHDAVAIGLLYQRARTSFADRLFCFAEAGDRLLSKKARLGHGCWLQWLRTHQSVLGFPERTAHKLIDGAQWMASNWELANKLEEIITDPRATDQDMAKADEIRQLISSQFRPTYRGTLGRRRVEWYTPREYLDKVRMVLGGIDVDPASNKHAQETVGARDYFDQAQDGLHRAWRGRVWLNPPYSRAMIGKFISKLLAEWDSGNVDACIALTHNFTDTAWFQDAAAICNAICFTQGRIKYYGVGGKLASPTQGQAFFYFGPEVERFEREFDRVGLIVRPQPGSWSRRRIRDEAQA